MCGVCYRNSTSSTAFEGAKNIYPSLIQALIKTSRLSIVESVKSSAADLSDGVLVRFNFSTNFTRTAIPMEASSLKDTENCSKILQEFEATEMLSVLKQRIENQSAGKSIWIVLVSSPQFTKVKILTEIGEDENHDLKFEEYETDSTTSQSPTTTPEIMRGEV